MEISNCRKLEEQSANSPQKHRIQSDAEISQGDNIRGSTQKAKYTNQQKQQDSQQITFSPNAWQKLLMLPLPFFCYGCFTFEMVEIQIKRQRNELCLTTYPGYFCCFSKTYTITFDDILGSKVEMVHHHRINRRQTYTLLLQTKSGDFQLTSPKVRVQILNEKNNLDELLRSHGINTGNPWLMVP